MTETRNSLPYVEHGSLKYTDPNRVKAVMLMADCPPNPYVNGYGRRIPTQYAIDYLGKGMVKRHHRVYVMNYGNSGSAYINVGGNIVEVAEPAERAVVLSATVTTPEAIVSASPTLLPVLLRMRTASITVPVSVRSNLTRFVVSVRRSSGRTSSRLLTE